MNVNHLRYFLSVLKHGSFRRAAEELHISQPALSNSIKALESMLGVELLVRDPRGVTPTPHGKAVAMFFDSAVQSVERSKREILLMKKGSRGHISVGAPSGLMQSLMTDIIAAVRCDYPQYTFSIEFGYLNDLLERLREGHLDVLVTTYWPEANLTTDLTVKNFARIPLKIFCRPTHPLAAKRSIEVEDLLNAEWIIPETPGTRTFLKDIFGINHLGTVSEPISSGYVPFIHAMMAKQDLLGIVPEYFIRSYIESGALTAINFPTANRELGAGLIYFAERLRTPAMLNFVRIAERVGASELTDKSCDGNS